MQNLKIQIENNYKEHPAFHFPISSWEVPDDMLGEFNKYYSAARRIGDALDNKSHAMLRQDCQHILDVIFSCLTSQSCDEYEKLFLTELKKESIRLLHEELSWHARQNKHHFTSLIGKTKQHNAILLATERYYFGRLQQAAVDEISVLIQSDLSRFHDNAVAGRLTREDLSINAGPVVHKIRNILNCEYKDLGVLDAVSAYTGRKIRVTGLAIELSVPQATWWNNTLAGIERAPRTLYAHLDETISCPKSIVYLTDVTEMQGPTGCYPGAYEAMHLNPLQELIGRVVGIVGNRADSPLHKFYAKKYHQSVNSENFRKHFMRLPEVLRFNSHLGWDVLPGGRLEDSLADIERKMIGPAGTFIIFDGARLMHRGGLIQEGRRVALQVIFSDVTLVQRVAGKMRRAFS